MHRQDFGHISALSALRRYSLYRTVLGDLDVSLIKDSGKLVIINIAQLGTGRAVLDLAGDEKLHQPNRFISRDCNSAGRCPGA